MYTKKLLYLTIVILLLIPRVAVAAETGKTPITVSNVAAEEKLAQELSFILGNSVIIKVDSSDAFVRGVATPIDAGGNLRPIVEEGTTYVPARFLSELLGAKVNWDRDSSVAAFAYNDKLIRVNTNSGVIEMDEEAVELGAEPFLIADGRILLPLRFIAEAFGREVFWSSTGLIFISKEELFKAEPDQTMLNRIANVLKVEKVEDLVKPSVVVAKIATPTAFYSRYLSQKKSGRFEAGEMVEVLQDRNRSWYLVKSFADGETGWVPGKHLQIPQDPPTNTQPMSKEEIEKYVNNKGFASDTKYLVWVDIDRQLTYVFLGRKGHWSLYRTMLSSTGTNQSPTVRGLFKVQDRGKWFYTSRFRSGAQNWVRFNGPYLFHSIPMDKQRRVIAAEAALGKRSSEGCIRLSVEDSWWMYTYLPAASTVYIN